MLAVGKRQRLPTAFHRAVHEVPTEAAPAPRLRPTVRALNMVNVNLRLFFD
jgi:hypothetical protein